MTKIVDSYTPPDIHELLKVYESGILNCITLSFKFAMCRACHNVLAKLNIKTNIELSIKEK